MGDIAGGHVNVHTTRFDRQSRVAQTHPLCATLSISRMLPSHTPEHADSTSADRARGPIVDTHLHVWDPTQLRYPWLAGHALLDRPYLLPDYHDATQGLDVRGCVFVQCEVDPAQSRDEAAWVASLAVLEPRIRGMVAWAPLEHGGAVAADLEALSIHPQLRGIRRIIQFEADADFCLRPAFIDGVRTLASFGLSFDICVDQRQMRQALRLAEQVPEVPMVLDHLGKPDIRVGRHEPWATLLRECAALPHVHCKISGVATEADHAHWTANQLAPYIDTAIDAFGFDRVMFGGDWPVALQAIRYRQWVELLDQRLRGVPPAERRRFWHDNAVRFYRLG